MKILNLIRRWFKENVSIGSHALEGQIRPRVEEVCADFPFALEELNKYENRQCRRLADMVISNLTPAPIHIKYTTPDYNPKSDTLVKQTLFLRDEFILYIRQESGLTWYLKATSKGVEYNKEVPFDEAAKEFMEYLKQWWGKDG